MRRWLEGGAGFVEGAFWGLAAIFPMAVASSLLGAGASGGIIILVPAGAVVGALHGFFAPAQMWSRRARRTAYSLAAAVAAWFLTDLVLG